jgi:hypothetical protein
MNYIDEFEGLNKSKEKKEVMKLKKYLIEKKIEKMVIVTVMTVVTVVVEIVMIVVMVTLVDKEKYIGR